MRKLITSGIAALAITGASLAVAAAPASAKVAPRAVTTTVTAATHITGRPDSGGSGSWATDSMTRTLTITHGTGTSYTATIKDASGSFTTGKGDFVPNQAASPGLKFTEAIPGTFTGSASFSFTASQAPSASLVPARASGSAPTDTSDWYKLAFPAGTVFGGTGILDTWGWTYTVQELCVTHHGPVIIVSGASQVWRDFASDNGGQGPGSPAAGSVTDPPAGCMVLA